MGLFLNLTECYMGHIILNLARERFLKILTILDLLTENLSFTTSTKNLVCWTIKIGPILILALILCTSKVDLFVSLVRNLVVGRFCLAQLICLRVKNESTLTLHH